MEFSIEERKRLIEPEYPQISIKRQCQLLGLSRSIIYYQPIKSQTDKELMDKIDQIYTGMPFYGQRRIKAVLNREGYRVGRDKIRSLMRRLGLETTYPKPKLSKSNKQHRKYPYLLKDRKIESINEVWGTDITYIRMKRGWLYLAAMLDWFSRFVLSWHVSNCMDEYLCSQVLEDSLKIAKPQIHNSDQGSQYTSNQYLSILETNNIRISMDAKGRCYDNIFTERLWRTVKYEEVYLKNYENPIEANTNLSNYFKFYNYRRLHQSLNYKTPAELYFN